jgi:hypothetical protein
MDRRTHKFEEKRADAVFANTSVYDGTEGIFE